MVASQVHLVRHGEVHNPSGILYGRLPGFRLSELGQKMAQRAADDVAARGRPIVALVASPLQRTQESAAPFATEFELPITTDARLIEPANHFEGTVMRQALRNPINWPWLVNPFRPSWGEAYSSIVKRMRSAVDAAFDSVESGDVVLVSHQLPIWCFHLALIGERFMHDPRKRRCALSSITTLERHGGDVVEVGYSEPAAPLAADATDIGAV
ncbi:histidine phosphatase family protein [Rathayibacter soli]|uniref:histidine phosphatase family protein n=1 Tax=Rathayibacter soli TaxID=3144168 RepID=UPI0027E4D125|nr:histidine phosphatase family protein [Glaciibacter superstes]